jgi:predicted phage terminase large subunit-like protein
MALSPAQIEQEKDRIRLTKLLEQQPELAASLCPIRSDFLPENRQPFPQQLAFLMLPHREAFYGGAAGGGKSDALLMGALQHVHIPGYTALLFRKTLTDLKMSGALLDRAHQWLSGHPLVRYVPSEHCFYFQTHDPNYPAQVQFGYIGDQGAQIRYQGIEIQYCAFDEVCQHYERDYTFMFSRMRRLVCPIHRLDDKGNPIFKPECQLCQERSSVPLRMRSASNPGGIGHAWIKKRFRIRAIEDPLNPGERLFRGFHPLRPFIPSFLTDNPYLDQNAYSSGLDELDPVRRAQYKKGNWDISEDSRFKASWAKRYSTRGEYFVLGPNGRGAQYRLDDLLYVFSTCDPAGSAREGPGDTERYKKMESWTVISTFGLTPDYNLLWLDMRRFRKEIPDIINELKAVYRRWRPVRMIIEINGLGRGAYQHAIRAGLPMKGISQHRDKVVRSTDAQVRMEAGKVWLPENAGWLNACEEELFTWTGHPDTTDDVVDTLSMAANDVSWEAAHAELDTTITEISQALPFVLKSY